MANRERPVSGDWNDWRIRATTAVTVAACMGGIMLTGPLIGIHGFWPGMLAGLSAIVVGAVLGRFVGGLLFPPSSGGTKNSPPAD